MSTPVTAREFGVRFSEAIDNLKGKLPSASIAWDDLMSALASTTAAIMVGAALLEALLPWPARFRPGATVPLLARLGHKVYRPDGSPGQQRQAGLLALLVVWVPCAAGLWAVRNLSLSEPLFDLLFLLLMHK